MSQVLDWRCFTVEDFFTQHNWTGIKQPQLSSISSEVKQPEVRVSPQVVATPTLEEKQAPQALIKPLEETKTQPQKPKKAKTVPWQCLSVEDFFHQNNWSGRLKQLNFQAVVDLNSLGSQEIEIGENLEDNLHNISEIKAQTLINTQEMITAETPLTSVEKSPVLTATAISNQPFSLTLSVQDFWAAFDWQGKPAIAVLPQSKTKKANSSQEEEFTLDDLSQLF